VQSHWLRECRQTKGFNDIGNSLSDQLTVAMMPISRHCVGTHFAKAMGIAPIVIKFPFKVAFTWL
jgi:hypothetical protein